jgi:hypothetical protein
MFIYDDKFGSSASVSLTDDCTAAELVTSAGLGASFTTATVRLDAAALRGLATEALAMADEIDTATIAAEVAAAAAEIDEPGADWPGCRLALTGAEYWHAARDMAPATLCGLTFANSDMTEDHVTGRQAMCPGCYRAVTAALVATGQLDPEAAEAAITEGAPGATPADYVQVVRWGRFMLSSDWFIREQQAAAHRDRAPVDAIYRSGDPRQGGRWVTAREVSNPLAIAALTGARS